MNEHTEYMQLALSLAKQGLGNVEPNPAVGCVLVKDEQIIGQGWHRQFGGPHAEINALTDCTQNGYTPAGATMFVTLEPCCHHGKTGPCSQAIIKAGIGRVFVAMEDPSEKVGGKGIAEIRAAGIDVEVGLCRQQAISLNRPFIKHSKTALPWVILKWAQSIDGKLAFKRPATDGHWISNPSSRNDVHRLRKKCQGILTGIGTVIADNPKLTVRLDGQTIPHPPIRIVLDSQLKIPSDCHLINDKKAQTIIFTTSHSMELEQEKLTTLAEMGIDVLTVNEHEGRCDLKEVLQATGQMGIQQLLIEAGPILQTAFLSERFADEVNIYTAPLILGVDGTADISNEMATACRALRLKEPHIDTFDGDVCIRGLV